MAVSGNARMRSLHNYELPNRKLSLPVVISAMPTVGYAYAFVILASAIMISAMPTAG